jgi:hypothetical protein
MLGHWLSCCRPHLGECDSLPGSTVPSTQRHTRAAYQSRPDPGLACPRSDLHDVTRRGVGRLPRTCAWALLHCNHCVEGHLWAGWCTAAESLGLGRGRLFSGGSGALPCVRPPSWLPLRLYRALPWRQGICTVMNWLQRFGLYSMFLYLLDVLLDRSWWGVGRRGGLLPLPYITAGLLMGPDGEKSWACLSLHAIRTNSGCRGPTPSLVETCS